MCKSKRNKDSNHRRIQIEEGDFTILQRILSKYPYRFYVYGSRARGEASEYSDIDIFCEEKIECFEPVSLIRSSVRSIDLIDIKTELEESDLAIKADVIDRHSCTQEFIEKIQKDFVEIKVK